MKICKYCSSDKHASWMCFDKPRKTLQSKSINKYGKEAVKWMQTRNEWLQQNPPQSPPWTALAGWTCHYCKKFITIEELTLDHKYARSGAPHLRYEQSNLVPCCYADNKRKGSMDYDVYCAKYYPYLLEGDNDEENGYLPEDLVLDN